MTYKKYIIFFCISLYVLGAVSCGIEEHYYLPQIPEENISINLNTEAVIVIPPIRNEYYYAGYYAIFYRIYTSNYLTSSSTDLPQISSFLSSDYNYFHMLSTPANTSSITNLNTFRSRNYFELEFEGADIAELLKKNSEPVTLRIRFPPNYYENPVASLNDGPEYNLRRSGRLISPEPRDDLYFRNTSELRAFENANSNINADVAGRSGEMLYTYVSMYIVTAGTNPSNFSPIYSNPTHINVFKLADSD